MSSVATKNLHDSVNLYPPQLCSPSADSCPFHFINKNIKDTLNPEVLQLLNVYLQRSYFFDFQRRVTLILSKMDLSPWVLSPTTAHLPGHLALGTTTIMSCFFNPVILQLSFPLVYKCVEVSLTVFLKSPLFHCITLYISFYFRQVFKNVCIVSTVFSLIHLT